MYHEDSSATTPHANNNGNGSGNVIVQPDFVSPPMTRTQTSQMGAMSADIDDTDVGNTANNNKNNNFLATSTTITTTIDVPSRAGQQQQRPLPSGNDYHHHYPTMGQGDGSVRSVFLSGSAA